MEDKRRDGERGRAFSMVVVKRKMAKRETRVKGRWDEKNNI